MGELVAHLKNNRDKGGRGRVGGKHTQPTFFSIDDSALSCNSIYEMNGEGFLRVQLLLSVLTEADIVFQ